MKCEEALTKIEAYINHTLNGRELEEFLEHVTSCQECYDELETYYIISVGMRYLEEENLESYNIPKMLQEDLHTRERQVRRRNILRKTAVLPAAWQTHYIPDAENGSLPVKADPAASHCVLAHRSFSLRSEMVCDSVLPAVCCM